MSSTAERVRKVVFEHCDGPESLITDDARFSEDLGMDSLTIVELVMALEEEFGWDIPDEAADSINTYGETLAYIEKHMASQNK